MSSLFEHYVIMENRDVLVARRIYFATQQQGIDLDSDAANDIAKRRL